MKTAAPVEPDAQTRIPRLVGVVWGLLLLNTLGYTTVALIIPFPRSVAQVITMAALAIAFGLALVLNPRVRLQPSAYLLLLSLLALLSLVSSMRLESGTGSILRCARLLMFVATLWLTLPWWPGDLRFARVHVRALSAVLLTVLAGLIISPGAAVSGPDGRLVGIIWPIPPTQVAQYCAVAMGLVAVLFLTRRLDGRSALLVAVPASGLLLLSHTRTALLGIIIALTVAILSVAVTDARARRFLVVTAAVVGAVATLFGAAIQEWLARGQDTTELSNLTGRQLVWDLLLAQKRTVSELLMGVGLTDKTYAGLPIDNSWLSIYHEQGWLGISIVVAILATLLITAALRPPSPERACAVFLIVYCISVSYTEVGLGDSSPYLLHLTVAAALLAKGGADTRVTSPAARWIPQ